MSKKLKRQALLVSAGLLVPGGLYYGLFRPGSGMIGATAGGRQAEAPPIPGRPAARADLTTMAAGGRTSPKTRQQAGSQAAEADVRPAGAGSAGARTARPQSPGAATNVTDRTAGRLADNPPGQEAAEGNMQAQALPTGIRLAPDVRLPVAAMPNDLNLNPIKRKALQDIVDEYYQTVAAATSGTTAEGDTGTGTSVIEENGEQTRIIANSRAVESARMRADMRFKALFGHAAYNRMTMNTLLESRLPRNATEP